MGILSWILLGGIAGWIASLIMDTNEQQGILANVVVGIIGALIGGFVVGLFGGEGVGGFSIYGLIVATIGAVILLGIMKMVSGNNTQSSK